MGYTHTHAWKVVNDLRSLANNQKGLLRQKYPAKKSGDMTKMQNVQWKWCKAHLVTCRRSTSHIAHQFRLINYELKNGYTPYLILHSF